MSIPDFIEVYENAFSDEMCDAVIKQFEDSIQSGASFRERPPALERSDSALYLNDNSSTIGLAADFNAVLVGKSEGYRNKYATLKDLNMKSFTVKVQKTEPSEGYHFWHCEQDSIDNSRRIIVWTVYLNDVDYSNGPFLFIRNSKSFDVSRRSNYSKRSLLQNIFILIGKMKLKDPRYDDQSINNFINKNKIIPEEIIGKAGTLVLFDGSFIHRGKNIEKGTRYSFTNYFYDDNIRSRYLINKRFQKLYIKKSFR